jgi:hypothetical protein
MQQLVAGNAKAENDPVMRFKIAEALIASQQWQLALRELEMAEECFEKSKNFPDLMKQRIWFTRSGVHKALL